jgi:phosphatidylcholine synthase
VKIASAAVHLFTALGAVAALMAMLAVADRNWEMVFVWLGVAFIMDGVDGTFARMVNVTEHLPRFSGERLDLVIDYVTYVFIPAYALLVAGHLEGPLGLTLAAGILLSSLFHFSDTDSKADDYSFVGFPAVWNIVAFYLFVFQVSPWVSAAVVALCVVLTFVPMRWVHPFRVEKGWPVIAAMCAAWAAASIAVTWSGFAASPFWAKAVLGAIAAATVALSLMSKWGARD